MMKAVKYIRFILNGTDYILSENCDEKYNVTAIYQQESDGLKLIKIVPQVYSRSSY